MAPAARLALACLILVPACTAQQVFKGERNESLGHALLVADLDGDGACEIVASAPRHTVGRMHYRGRVVVIRGGEGSLEQRAAVWMGPRSGSQVGSSLACGDLDGDGAPDLAVGAHPEHRGRGAVFVLRGSRRGGILDGGDLGSGNMLLELHGTTPGGGLGHAVALGDLDGDGLADLAVSEPMGSVGRTPSAGRVLVYRGRRKPPQGALEVGQGAGQPDLVLEGRENEYLGTGLLAADLTGDGICELVVLSPDRPGRSGRSGGGVVVLRGGRSFWKDAKDTPAGADDAHLTVRGPGGSELGAAAAVLRDDGPPTLLVGAPGSSLQGRKAAGALYALTLPPKPAALELPAAGLPERMPLVLEGGATGERLGGSLAALPAGPLLSGTPGGNLAMLYHPPLQPGTRPTRMLRGPRAAGRTAFGAAVGLGDVDGDGQPEAVVAAPAAGSLHVFDLQ